MPPAEAHLPESFLRIGRIGGVLALVFVVGFLVWAAIAELEAGAVAAGSVIPDGETKTIQHLDGGIITEILVQDGAHVEKGQPLLRLDETEAKGALVVAENEYQSLAALVERLTAERDGVPVGRRDGELSQAVLAQIRLSEVRRNALNKTLAIGTQRMNQIRQEIEGLESEGAALRKSLELVQEELDMFNASLAKGFISRRDMLATQSRHAQLEGELGQNSADIALARQRISELEVMIGKVKDDWLNEVLTELRKAEDDLAAAAERLRVARERLARCVIAAPESGIVNGLKYTTRGGVIPPGGVVLHVIPTHGRLLVEARIEPDDIDVVRVGLKSYVRLTAYRARTHEAWRGKVSYVSADTFQDDRGERFYKAHVALDDLSQSPEVDGLPIQPGMLAQVEIAAGGRTVLRYLLDPVLDSFDRAFREQ